jgi:hypothetical protein
MGKKKSPVQRSPHWLLRSGDFVEGNDKLVTEDDNEISRIVYLSRISESCSAPREGLMPEHQSQNAVTSCFVNVSSQHSFYHSTTECRSNESISGQIIRTMLPRGFHPRRRPEGLLCRHRRDRHIRIKTARTQSERKHIALLSRRLGHVHKRLARNGWVCRRRLPHHWSGLLPRGGF